MRKTTILLVAVALLAAACSGSDGSDGVASLESDDEVLAADADAGPDEGTAAEVDDEEAMLAFAQCLRDQGLDIADPEVDDDGNLRLARPTPGEGEQIDREAFRTARDACADILEGVSFGFREFDRTEIEDTLVEFATCMRDNGYEMPDPDFSTQPGPGGGGPFGDIDPDDPAFEAANEACQDILAAAFGDDGPPGRGPGGGGPGGGGQG